MSGNYDLVNIESNAEYTFLKGKVTQPMWIGLHDGLKEGEYIWSGGTRLTFGKNLNNSPWCPGEPNNGVITVSLQ